MNEEAIVLVNPVSSGTPFKMCAKKQGLKVVGIFTQSMKSFENMYHLTPEALFKECDETVVSDNLQEILKKLRASNFSIKGVIAASEGGVEMADQIAHELQRIGPAGVGRLSQKMNDDFGVGRALKNMAVVFILAAEERGVDQIAVMGDGNWAEAEFTQQRLGIA